RRNSHDVVDIAACPILTPGMQSTLEYLRESVDWISLPEDRIEMDAVSGEGGRISTFSSSMPEAAAEISIDVAGETYFYSAETFFQANRFLIERLIDAAIGDAEGETA